MARPKSPSGSKANRVNNKEQIDVATQPVAAQQVASEVKALSTKPAPAENKTTAEIKAETRKLEVVKSEPRKNILPINLEDEVRRRAYELYQQRGGNGAGSEAEDWFSAEREIRQRYRQQSA